MLYCFSAMIKAIPTLKLFSTLILISILILIFDNFGFLSLPKKLLSFITNPISFGLYNTNKNIGSQFGFVFQARMSAKENKALKEQLGSLLSENARLRKDLAESQSLFSQQISLDPATYNLIAARPIGLGRYLKIDRGSNSKIKVG